MDAPAYDLCWQSVGCFTNEIYRKGIRSDNALRRAAGKTYDALLETARGRSETLESGRVKEFASVNWRRMAGVTIRILLVILPALILQFWSIWYRRADEIVPRGLLLVKFVRRADGKKNGILALMK